MTDDLKQQILQILNGVAPGLELETLDGAVDLREQIDIDSMDILNFAIGLNKAFGIDIPEADYPKLVTIDGCIAYVAARRGAA